MPSNITLSMIRETLYSAVVSDALDSMGYRHQSPRVLLRPYGSEVPLVGRCKTTLWMEMYHADIRPYELELLAVDSCRADDVMICAANGSIRSALWGELLSTASRNSGCIGAIVDGAVRDVARMRAMGFSVFARGTSVYDSQGRQRVVEMDLPIEIDGVQFNPGDLVFADLDGVVVVPREAEQEAIQRAWNKVFAENNARDAIRSGMKATDAFQQHGVL
jgi:regulator of RNase E activity RraA